MDSKNKFQYYVLLTFMLVCLCCFTACWDPYEEACNQIFVKNDTKDTLILIVGQRHLCPSCPGINGDNSFLFPNTSYRIGANPRKSGFELLNSYCGYALDTVRVYKIICDTCGGMELFPDGIGPYYVTEQVAWGGPLLDLHSSIHSFYNKNSWVFSKNPIYEKSTVITFTITDDDLKTN